MTSAPQGPASPVSPSGLAGLIADRATASPGLRLGIDGPVRADARDLADAVAAQLEERAVDVARVRADDYLRARSLRLEHGPDNPDSFFDGWYDLSTLRREVLDPMAPATPLEADPGGGRIVARDDRAVADDRSAALAGSTRHWLPRLRDPVTDRPYREPRRRAAASTVVVLDGRFLARWDVADALDVLVHLDVSPAARARRVPADERARVLPAWERYLEWCRPAAAAALVVRYDRPSHPAVATPAVP